MKTMFLHYNINVDRSTNRIPKEDFMVENIYFKVLPAGEGKTRWLVEKAFKEINNGKKVVFLSKNSTEFEKFSMYYRTLFAMYCPVIHASTSENVPEESIVLIDELAIKLTKENINLNLLKAKCSAIFVTVEGKTID